MTGISRRSLMIGAAAGAGTLALGTAPPASAATFVKGADISWMPQMETNGYYWLNGAYDVSKQVFPATPVMVHLAQPQKMDSVQRFFNAYRGNGGRWDITALSSYAQGSNVSPILGSMRTIQSTYGKPVMQVEYGGPIGNPGQVRDSLRQLITGIKGFGGLGTFYWEPAGYSPFTGYNMTAWGSNRRPTAAMDGFLNM
jgi:arabinogalactan endo-1,4-beta-galactosidase